MIMFIKRSANFDGHGSTGDPISGTVSSPPRPDSPNGAVRRARNFEETLKLIVTIETWCGRKTGNVLHFIYIPIISTMGWRG